MKTFSAYTKQQVLAESLDSASSYYLTDDTLLPSRIYAVFDLENDQYGMSLEQSDFTGIYILSFYRILAKQKRIWSIKKPSHLRICLATLLKFAEVSLPMIRSRVKGIIVKIPGQNASRYIKLATRIIKQSLIKSFKVLLVQKNPDKKLYDWENLFLARTGISPSSIYADKKFQKNYDFEDEVVMNHEISADIKPIRPSKKTVKTDPSKKFTSSGFEIIDVSIDDELFTKISTLEYQKEDESSSSIDEDFKQELSSAIGKENAYKLFDSYLLSVSDNEKKSIYKVILKYVKNKHKFFGDLMFTYLSQSELNEIDKIKTVQEFNNIVLKLDLYYKISRRQLRFIELFGISDFALKEWYIDEQFISDLKTYLSNGSEKSWVNNISKLKSIELHKIKKLSVKTTNIDPTVLSSTMPADIDFIYDTSFQELMYKKNYDDLEIASRKKTSYIQNTLGYYKHVGKLSTVDDVVSYTGSTYEEVNSNLRQIFSAYSSDEKFMKPSLSHTVSGMIKAFDDIKQLDDPFWVYRTTDVPPSVRQKLEIGNDFIDPGILSTSSDPSFTFGGNDKFRIYLPKGSKIIPILDHSHHHTEREVILPPMSVIKIIRIDTFSNDYVYYTGIFVGSIFKDFMSKYQQNSSTIQEATKKKPITKYDPNQKFGGTKDSKTLEQMMDYLKKNKPKK